MAISFSVKNVVQPSVVGGLVLDNSLQKGIFRIPKNVLRDFKN